MASQEQQDDCTLELVCYRPQPGGLPAQRELGSTPKNLGELLECFPALESQRALRETIARPDPILILPGYDTDLCVCHVKVRRFSEISSLKRGDVVIQRPTVYTEEVRYTPASPPPDPDDSWEPMLEMYHMQHDIKLEEDLTTVESTWEGSAPGGGCTPPRVRGPGLTSTPAQWPYNTGDYIPLTRGGPIESPSPVKAPSPVREVKKLRPGYVLRLRHPQIMPHPRLIGDMPLVAVHPPHRMAHDVRTRDPALVDLFHFNGHPILKIEGCTFYSRQLGGPATYGHRDPDERLGPGGTFQMIAKNPDRNALIREVLWAVKYCLKEMDIPIFIDRVEVSCPETPHQYLYNTSRSNIEDSISISETAGTPHGPGERVTPRITIKEPWTKNCLTLVEALLHELAHVLSPCPYDTVTESQGHDLQWINCMANLIRHLNKAPHGPQMQKMRFIMTLKQATWSDILMVFPTRLSHSTW